MNDTGRMFHENVDRESEKVNTKQNLEKKREISDALEGDTCLDSKYLNKYKMTDDPPEKKHPFFFAWRFA